MRFIGAAVALAPTCAAGGACTGDDPVVVPSTDAGNGDGRSVADASPDNGVDQDGPSPAPACAGRAFDPPVAIAITDAALDRRWILGLRVQEGQLSDGARVFFPTRPVAEAGVFLPALAYRALYTRAASPSLGTATELSSTWTIPPYPSQVWSVAVAADGAFMLLSFGVNNSRALHVATPEGGGFGTPASIGDTGTTSDDADGWILGRPQARAILFGRRVDLSKGMVIHRSTVIAGTPPAFGRAVPFGVACPESKDCSTPVLTADESILLFTSFDRPTNESFEPHVFEQAVSGGTPTGSTIPHEELGNRYPSWISDDGCEVLLAGGGRSAAEVAYARRHP